MFDEENINEWLQTLHQGDSHALEQEARQIIEEADTDPLTALEEHFLPYD